MDERVMQFRVGVMVLFALLVTGILLVLFGKVPRWVGTYPIRVEFESAAGVTPDTPVRISGVLIGRVADVELTEADAKVLITLKIDKTRPLYQNQECFISRDLLGDTAIAFVANRRKPGAGKRIEPGALIRGEVSDDPTGLKRALSEPIDTVTETGRALSAASKQLEAAAKRVEDILNQDAQRDVRDILRDSAKSLKTIQRMLGDEQNQNALAESIKRLPNTLDNMNRTFEATEDALHKFTKPSGPDDKSAVERMVLTVEMMEKTLARLNQPNKDGQLPADQIAVAMENMGEITTLIRNVLSRIEQGDGSLGALLKDPELYNRLCRAAKNVEQITRDIKPIINDARVLSDKVSRHPGVLIRDAVRPGAGVK